MAVVLILPVFIIWQNLKEMSLLLIAVVYLTEPKGFKNETTYHSDMSFQNGFHGFQHDKERLAPISIAQIY